MRTVLAVAVLCILCVVTATSAEASIYAYQDLGTLPGYTYRGVAATKKVLFRKLSTFLKQPRFSISEQLDYFAHGCRWVYPGGIG